MSQDYLWLETGTWKPALAAPSECWRSRQKRALDLVLAAILAPMVGVVVLLAALALTMTGQRPFYRHERIGRGGVPFRCLKLRSMTTWSEVRFAAYLAAHPEAEMEFRTTGKLVSDPRISRLGHLLRKSSIDELPQIVNVLRGQMSLVGPRPITRAELDGYLDHQRRAYLSVRPGLTGLWQVSGRNTLTMRQRARLDTRYAQTPSLLRDLGILLRTIPVVLRGTGI